MTFSSDAISACATTPLMVDRPWAKTKTIANGHQVLAWLGSSVLLMGVGALYSWSLVHLSDAIGQAQFQPVKPHTIQIGSLD